MPVKDLMVRRRPPCQKFCDPRAKILIAPEIFKEVSEHAVIKTVVAGRQIETGAERQPAAEGVFRCLVELFVAFGPLPVKPRTGLACIKMPKSFYEISGFDPRKELLRN